MIYIHNSHLNIYRNWCFANMQDIIHCHDWSSAPVSWLFKDQYMHYGLSKARVVFTIHNLEFGQELIGKAMAYSDKATTVSARPLIIGWFGMQTMFLLFFACPFSFLNSNVVFSTGLQFSLWRFFLVYLKCSHFLFPLKLVFCIGCASACLCCLVVFDNANGGVYTLV